MQTWDRANRLALVTTGGVTMTFGYDAAGALAVKTVATTNTVTPTHYLGGYYERTVGGAARRYYLLGDQLVLYDGTAYHYLYGDHLNSATLTTDAAGTKTSETRYFPYGAHRYDWGSDPSDRDFTGQRRDVEIALLDYVARRYSHLLRNSLGHWMNDTLVRTGIFVKH
jgi:YD repeat-containing protein